MVHDRGQHVYLSSHNLLLTVPTRAMNASNNASNALRTTTGAIITRTITVNASRIASSDPCRHRRVNGPSQFPPEESDVKSLRKVGIDDLTRLKQRENRVTNDEHSSIL